MKNESVFEKEYLTVSEVRNYLCISSTAAYELIHRADFPVCHFGSVIRVPSKYFRLWIDQHTKVPAGLQM